MHHTITFFFLLLFITTNSHISSAAELERLEGGKWRLDYNTASGEASLWHADTVVLPAFTTAYRLDTIYTGSDYTTHRLTRRKVKDVHGRGTCYEIRHTAAGLPDLLQRFYIYPGRDYLFTETELVSVTPIACGYMAPVVSERPLPFLGEQGRFLFVPFDNDAWVRYNVSPLAGAQTGYEVAAFFLPATRRGFVIGSVEHDRWKTGVRAQSSEAGALERLECFGGITSELTRDVLPHGRLNGRSIKSPRILIGMFDDWRTGMEEYAKANARIAPAPEWKQGVPFGWNSWGSIQQHITYDKAIQVSDFIKHNLQHQGFSNDSTVYIDLDSFWDNFTDEQLRQFVDHCHANGQKAGIYWVPFTDWFRDPSRHVEGTTTPYRDVYLYANGKEQAFDGAWAIDPTHPAVQRRIDYFTARFHAAGFEFIKIDFLTHGSMEADSHADPAVTTGIQAYNQGMDYLLRAFKGKFFITQAISPVFPSCYAHSRRIACDAFAAIGDTEYTLNGLSYGWWLDNAYRYNDPDHLLMYREGITEGENRARVTSGLITGLFMNGDDLTSASPALARERVKTFFTDPGINAVARIGRSFRPVYGFRPSASGQAENCFMLRHGGDLYVAVFNFSKEQPLDYHLPLADLGVIPAGADKAAGLWNATELWSRNTTQLTDHLGGSIPAADAHIWKISQTK